MEYQNANQHVWQTFPYCCLSFALRQNTELAKLRQECAKLTKEVEEKTESLHADEHVRKGLETKLSAAEKQLSLLQVGPSCGKANLFCYY